MRIHPIDLHFQSVPQAIAAFLVESGSELGLIETGPSPCLPALDAGIRALGFDPQDISKVALTHIHLDHAGAAGHWAERGAQIYVHERGARHLAEPAKLIEGAKAVYGDAFDSLWGEILPVPAAQITALKEGDFFELGPTRFAVWDTPGHAKHHLAFVAEGLAFTGDTAGVRLPGCDFLSPATAPSQFDPVALLHSLQRLRAAKLDRIYLTHFGPVDAVEDHLDRYVELIQDVVTLAEEHLGSGAAPEDFATAFTARLRKQADATDLSEDDWQRYQAANESSMCADGIRLWWESLRPRESHATA
jgi:glyoxylase-like metal-dependent hydrolase (beta-lactamase superfamily II)